MSVVTSICILSGYNLTKQAEAVYAGLAELGFVDAHEHCGGNKVVQGEVWLAAFNYLSTDPRFATLLAEDSPDGEPGLLRRLKALPWDPEAKPLFFISREDDSSWLPWEEK